MQFDLDKLNSMLPRCLSTFDGEGESAWRAVRKMLVPAIAAKKFSEADFKIGGLSAPPKKIVSEENITDIVARETAYLKGQVETFKRMIARLEKEKNEAAARMSDTIAWSEMETLVKENDRLTKENQRLHLLTETPNSRPNPKPRKQGGGELNDPVQYQNAFQLCFIDGHSAAKTVEMLGLVGGAGVIDGTFYNRGPNEKFLGKIPIGNPGDPMDYKEYWKIGWTLFRREWKAILSERLTIRKGSKNPTKSMTQSQMDQLRELYHSRHV